jgi:hypothetical protein
MGCVSFGNEATLRAVGMEIAQARKVLAANALDDEGSFYGPAGTLSLGAGLIISEVQFPYFNRVQGRFVVSTGAIYVLSHECDLDAENDKVLGGYCLICPLIQITDLIASAESADLSQNDISAFLGNLAARRISRFVYLPPLTDFPFGAALNLNQITSTAIELMSRDNVLTAVSTFGLTTIDMALDNHLRRAKSEALPLAGAPLRKHRSIRG